MSRQTQSEQHIASVRQSFHEFSGRSLDMHWIADNDITVKRNKQVRSAGLVTEQTVNDRREPGNIQRDRQFTPASTVQVIDAQPGWLSAGCRCN